MIALTHAARNTNPRLPQAFAPVLGALDPEVASRLPRGAVAASGRFGNL